MRSSDWSSYVCSSDLVDVFVTPEEVAAQLEAAEVEFDRQEAEKAARLEAEEQAKAAAEAAFAEISAELLALHPAPAVIALGDMTFFRWESGVWCDESEEPDADPVYELGRASGEERGCQTG